uniref:Glycoside hydrolase family 78 protein n=1 Tax=Schizophyllum commune (strain H4-8 / FGSC 9210) TaxID=578458 RepID=D8Q5F2_SCHCM
MSPTHLILVWALISCATASAPSGPWDDFNYAPASRTVYPAGIHGTNGDVENTDGLLSADAGSATLSGTDAWVTIDFGKEVGGVVSLVVDSVSGDDASLALAFAESPSLISPTLSDDSVYPVADMTSDGAQPITGPLSKGLWTQPISWQRGGFRYLTVSLTAGDSVSLSNVSVALTFSPNTDNLRDYKGYFYTRDTAGQDQDLLTKVWYAGAYTIQTNIIAADQGRGKVASGASGWNNSGQIAKVGPVIVDAARRDRYVVHGDMGIAGPAAFVALNELESIRNSLDEMFSLQDTTTGGLPYCGPLISIGPGESDTYHAWSLVGVYNYWMHSGNNDWLKAKWDQYVLGVSYLASKVDSDVGLLNATGPTDWGRLGGGGFSISPNVLYYKVLVDGAAIATALGESETARQWLADGESLKDTINAVLWDNDKGLYIDNTTTTLHPQDGNSLAVWFNVTASDEQKARISVGLEENWVDVGAVAPELPDNVAPFVGGMELHAHFEAGAAERALEFVRLQWGWMLTTNVSAQSTLLEGYTSNGSLLYRADAGYANDPSYTSHSHGWSTGPTPALTAYVLGLMVTEPAGQTFRIQPQTAGLPAAEGGFETPLGWFGVSWSNDSANGRFELNVTAPEGTQGVVIPPVAGDVTVDGNEVGQEGEITVQGGMHSIVVQGQ